jgi:hypothetical protein
MATDEERLRGLVGQTLSASLDDCAEVSIALLRSMAHSLVQIVGEQGTDLLLQRVVHRVASKHPWFQLASSTPRVDPGLAALRACFEKQEPVQLHAAIMLFFGTLIDILISLIGEHLTTSIFNSALSGATATTSSKQQGAE